MLNAYTYGYLKEAVKAHLDLEEEELVLMNINTRFHIFANEAVQYLSHEKPKYQYFQFNAVTEFRPTVYDNGVQRVATDTEVAWEANGLTEPKFASDEETAVWYNAQHIYLVGQEITMPNDFLAFANKKAFMFTDFITNKQVVSKNYMQFLSSTNIVVFAAATYLIPYQATWLLFSHTDEDTATVPMPSDLALTIPIYVASIHLQQRNSDLAKAKRQEFEIAVSRCRVNNVLENKSVASTF